MNKLKRILCAMLCVCMISIPMAIPTTVSAEDSISDLEQQLQQLEQENQKYQKILDDTKSDIAEKEEYKSALVSKVQVLDEKIAVTREKISSLNDDIKEKQDAYDKGLSEVEDQFDALANRLRILYMSGNATDLEIIFGAKDFSDLIDKMELVKSLANSDKELISEIQTKLDELSTKKKSLEADKKDLETQQASLKSDQDEFNKLISDNNDELLIVKKVEDENKEESTKNIYLTQRAEILSKQEERVKEDLNTQEQTIKSEENISTDNTNIEALKQEDIKDKVIENKVIENKVIENIDEQRVENKLATEQKHEEPVQEIKDNDHKDETILLEPKTTLETKTLEDVKTDENSEEVNHEVSNIDDFFDRFEKKVYSNIDRNFDKTTFKRGDFVNIRVTILKDGSYEQLTFLNGNSDYFNKVKPQIEEIFPLKIEENLKSHFPRYYRMKIDF